MTCPLPEVLVEQEIDRILTQYRESPKLLHVMRTWLRQVEQVISVTCSLPTFFDIETAVGDQLTLIGKRMGWGRCHCVCVTQPVFGFECEGVVSDYVIAGFCDDNSTWVNCGPSEIGEMCITDDEIYRRFLFVRRYQMMSLYDIESLTAAVKTMWGETATVLDAGHGRVVLAPGRELNADERNLLPLAARVMPVAPGIRQRYHLGTNLNVFGFGEGWGGFCEPFEPDGLIEGTSGEDFIVTSDGDFIVTSELTVDAPWMCEIDVHPYSCPGD